MIGTKEYLGDNGLKGFRASEILMLKSKSAKGVENPENPSARITGVVCLKDTIQAVGPEHGKVNRECAYYLVKTGAAIPKPASNDKKLSEDYKNRKAAAQKALDAREAIEAASITRKNLLADPKVAADIKAATEKIIADAQAGKK